MTLFNSYLHIKLKKIIHKRYYYFPLTSRATIQPFYQSLKMGKPTKTPKATPTDAKAPSPKAQIPKGKGKKGTGEDAVATKGKGPEGYGKSLGKNVTKQSHNDIFG